LNLNMKNLNLLLLLLLFGGSAICQPSGLECIPQPVYKLRADGTAGREILVKFTGGSLMGAAQVEVQADRQRETVTFPALDGGRAELSILLPAGVSVTKEAKVTITVRQGSKTMKSSVKVPPMRQWTVYVYPHSHVDIGYTNTQANVEILHRRNIDEGIKLAEATKDYPEGSRYCWNPEVTWPLERWWLLATADQKANVVEAIKKGWLCLDASYLNTNTSACSDEELFQLFRFSREMQKLTGVPSKTIQQMDIPGMAWGIVPVMAQQGVKYVMSWPNACRAGYTHSLDEKPFWWVGPDGKSKVLFFQPGSYANSGSMGKGGAIGRPWFGQRDPEKVPAVIKTGSCNVDFLKALQAREKPDYPYDYYVVSWCLWDNTPIDADLPDAVRAWNETYAFPHLVISGADRIMGMIEEKYGDMLPTVSGDFTEYWTDGLGTAAGLTAINRNAKEKLVQAEILWTMLRPGKPMAEAEFNEAWRYIALGTEHTWCAENPTEPYFQDAIWKVKQSYFREAADRTQVLLDAALAPATDRSTGALGPAEGPSNGGIVVFNTNSWSHGGLVTLTPAESRKGDIVEGYGKWVPSQRLSTGELVFLADAVPASGSVHFRVIPGKSPWGPGCRIEGNKLIGNDLTVEIDPKTGNIIHLIRKDTGVDLAAAGPDGGLNVFRWMPGDTDEAQPDSVISIEVVEPGGIVAELKIISKAPGCRSVTRTIRLIQGLPWLEITNVVDKLPLTAKDGVHFGFNFSLPAAVTRVDIPWGVMQVEADQWKAANRNYLAMQRWVDISNDQQGITWCSLDAALFEHGGLTANQTGDWSGERKPWLTRLEPSSSIWSWVMNNHWFTNFPLTQDGPVTFRYRILPHGAYNAATANRFGLEQAQPLVALAADKNPITKPLIAIEGAPAVTVSSMKSSGDGKSVIIRLRSVSDKPETVRLTWPAGMPQLVSLCEREECPSAKIDGEIVVPAMGMVVLKAVW
jgi:hypothetical protein